MTFDPGDVVQLKSGGPAMTVVSEDAEGVHCIWHANPSGDLKTGVVPAVCLDALDLDDIDFLDNVDEDEDLEDLEIDPDDDGEIARTPKKKSGEH